MFDQEGTTTSYWLLADHLGTTREVLDNSGNLVRHYVFDAYGNLEGTIAHTRLLFAGRELDSITGLYYVRARWYDPAVGRWVSEDPIGFAGGDTNLARYVANSPVNYTDPSGLEWTGEISIGPVHGPPLPPGYDPDWARRLFEHNPNDGDWEHTPDELKLIDLAGDDEASQIAVKKILEILKGSPGYPYRPWPLAEGDRCLKWAGEMAGKIFDAQLAGEISLTLTASQRTMRYFGAVPTFTVHSLVEIKLPNGERFYLDNALYGGCDDHIFFELPAELDGSPKHKKYMEERAKRLMRVPSTSWPGPGFDPLFRY